MGQNQLIFLEYSNSYNLAPLPRYPISPIHPLGIDNPLSAEAKKMLTYFLFEQRAVGKKLSIYFSLYWFVCNFPKSQPILNFSYWYKVMIFHL